MTTKDAPPSVTRRDFMASSAVAAVGSLAAARLTVAPDRDFAAKHRDFAATKLTSAQIAEAEKLAREWKEK